MRRVDLPESVVHRRAVVYVRQSTGTQVQDINRLIKQWQQMDEMMKKFRKMGKKGIMRQGLKGLLPR